MAFNPLHQFRKHQKVVLAGLTIMCMIIFVLSFGRGDPIERLSAALGMRRGQTELARLYGREITQQEIIYLRERRMMANTFMDEATALARAKVVDNFKAASSNFDEETKKQVQNPLMFWELAHSRDPQARFYYQYFVGQIRSLLNQLQMPLLNLEQQKKTEEAKQLLAFMQALADEDAQAHRPKGQLYFGGSTTPEDLLEFLIMDHQADRLGIQMNEGTVGKLIKQQTRDQFDKTISDNSLAVLRMQRGANAVNVETVLDALKDEFRVQMAQMALLGYNPASYRSRWPSPLTPYQFWQFYKEQCTQIDVDMLPVPVRASEFLAKVPEPTADELKTLFEKYKDVEPNPASPTPGFKHPAAIKIEWVKADMSRYREEAAKIEKLVRGLEQLTAASAANGFAATATAVTLPFAFDVPLIAAYEGSRFEYRLSEGAKPEVALKLYPGLYRAENAASVVGQAPAIAGGPAVPFGALGRVAGVVASEPAEIKALVQAELARNIVQGSATLVLGASGGFPSNLASLLKYDHGNEQFVPFDVVKNQLALREREERAERLARENLDRFNRELTARAKLQSAEELRLQEGFHSAENLTAALGVLAGTVGTGAPTLPAATVVRSAATASQGREVGRQAAEAVLAGVGPPALKAAALAGEDQALLHNYLDAFVAREIERLHLERGAMQEFRDREDIAQDPALAALKPAYLKIRQRAEEDPDKQFAASFFELPNLTTRYTPESLDPFLYWKIADKPAYTPDFADVKNKVRDWWRLDKARALAKAEAEKLAAEAKKAGDPDRTLKDASVRFGGKLIELKGVARLVPPPAHVMVESLEPYHPYAKPKDIEYPKPTWDAVVEELLEKLKNKGDTLVLTDQPENTYYVAALLQDPAEPTKDLLGSFYKAYQSQPYNLLVRLDKDDRFRREYRQTVLAELRKEAGLDINRNVLKSMEKKSEGRVLDDQ